MNAEVNVKPELEKVTYQEGYFGGFKLLWRFDEKDSLWFLGISLRDALGFVNTASITGNLSVDEMRYVSHFSSYNQAEDDLTGELGFPSRSPTSSPNSGEENKATGKFRKMIEISESGMYVIIMRCNDLLKAGTTAYKFRKIVTTEILPQIRTTGIYAGNKTLGANDTVGLITDERIKLHAFKLPIAKGLLTHDYKGQRNRFIFDEKSELCFVLKDFLKALKYSYVPSSITFLPDCERPLLSVMTDWGVHRLNCITQTGILHCLNDSRKSEEKKEYIEWLQD